MLCILYYRRQSWGVGGRAPPVLGREVVGRSQGGSWTGHKILVYLIMYRKYVRKWSLLKRNRIICLEIAVNSQFLPGKSKVFVKLPEKIEICQKFARKLNFFVKFPNRSKFVENLP